MSGLPQVLQSNSNPIYFFRPWGDITHSLCCHGGSCLKCLEWPHDKSATQCSYSSWWKPVIFVLIRVLIFFVTHINMPFASTRLKGFKTYFWDHKQTNRKFSPNRLCILIDNHDFSFKFIIIGHAYVHTSSFLDFLRLVTTIWSHEVLPTICCSTSKFPILFLVLANSVILLRYNYRHLPLSIKKLKWTKLCLKEFFS